MGSTMYELRLVVMSTAIGVCISALSLPAVARDSYSDVSAGGQPATLEYSSWAGNIVDLAEIDGHEYETPKKSDFGYPTKPQLFNLAPGTHTVRFRSVRESIASHPDMVEFDAVAGGKYRADFEVVNLEETVGQTTALYFNALSPVILEKQGRKYVKIVAGASAPFGAELDAHKNYLLYEHDTIPETETARVYCPRQVSAAVRTRG